MNSKTLLLSLSALYLITISAFASENSQLQPPPVYEGKIIENPDIPPIYTGGPGEMNKFISGTLRYPSDAVERNVQGLVVYTFIV
ncbi:MAG TPA: hypothetical protein DDZ57_00395, partial [Porphyromonadaceae bacterium]|nr:hypothetical protein [Porphyromonadaceae bacterium]HCF81341.1 hypothetical protein [Porphyromonadaceae bacterium]